MTQSTQKKLVVLITVSGPDAPGITSELTRILAQSGGAILDIGQSVILGLLSLSILFEMEPEEAKNNSTLKDLLFKAKELGLKLDFQAIEEPQLKKLALTEKSNHYAISLIGEKITAQALSRVAAILAVFGINIDRMRRMSEGEFGAVELQVSSGREVSRHELKKDLLLIARECQVDVAFQEEGLFRRAKRLIAFDMDSTLIQNEVIDELAREYGVYDEVSGITKEAMGGNMDFNESLKRRCSLLKGFPIERFEKVISQIKLTPGADDLIHVLKHLGYKVALISGGFTFMSDRLKTQLGIDYAYANTLEIQDGTLTGGVIPPIVNAQRKADLLDLIAQQERISLDQVIAVGDGANDLLMLEKAGLGIAFNAKAVVSEKAHLSINQKNLRSILYLLGISSRELRGISSLKK